MTDSLLTINTSDEDDNEDFYETSDAIQKCIQETDSDNVAALNEFVLRVYEVTSDSVSLCWDTPAGEVQNYTVTCCSGEDVVQELQTHANSLRISDLKPGRQYLFSVSTWLKNGQRSQPTVTSAATRTYLESVLDDLGLLQHYKQKLSLGTVLQIDDLTITDQPAETNVNLARCFLKKLMMVNVTARNVKSTTVHDTSGDDSSEIAEFLDNICKGPIPGQVRMNPLDIITGLFLCSDGFVQQELSLKMSMCQFAVPLLLPNIDTNQCTMMLWAMRDIVKKYRPECLSESKGFIEERIVLSEIPVISFVRLGECSLSKSEIINKLMSNSQHYHDTFVHRDMQCGDCTRKISNGLAEITWFLPCGNKNLDIFSEPVAVANLRGDIALFETQYAFLCQTSSAVFVFCENMSNADHILLGCQSKAQMFLVGNQQSKKFNLDTFKSVAQVLKLTRHNIILKTSYLNDADFIRKLEVTVKSTLKNPMLKMSVQQMADVARELGIQVDEDYPECQKAKLNADAITSEIHDTLDYKERQLPLQGEMWKEITSLEKEEFRLQKILAQNIEVYKSHLQEEKIKLRELQNSHDMTRPMSCFISAISSEKEERCYFLKWMRINLDDLSRKKILGLREQYKEKSKQSDNRQDIKDIDRQLSSSSLGTEHFFREMGQIYEASVSLADSYASRQQLQHLPGLCAQLLLDGFPLELVDGDASNIPLRWVSDILSQLHKLVFPKSKILVVTVLGVQSTGKSTLLNTMFGVQFAVNSGRCTRGAFMLLIRISEDVKQTLNCDFLVVIDTEGLKSQELAQLDDSYEHDNELATLVVGLSDLTIINIAMENATEMKDILQIVVHAFLRMKEVGKKPKCQFVHQNVSDVSAHEKNLRDRKLFLQQLNEMTEAAAKIEKKKKYKCFTDVMEYNPDTGNCYIPGLWNGNPPMAPVNAGYSEAVYELKKNIIKVLGQCVSSSNNILEFHEWITSIWNSIKHENFIFSFRNSLVADAYMKLCSEFNKWEWSFRKAMYRWVTTAETRILNFGTVAVVGGKPDFGQLLNGLKEEACTELSKWEDTLLDNLTQYFNQKEGNVYLVEGYIQDFANSAKSLRRQLQSSVMTQLTAAADIKQGQAELDKLKKKHTDEIEKRVCQLLEDCRKKQASMTDQELHQEFDEMWDETVKQLSFPKPKPLDIFNDVYYHLRQNLSLKGGYACQVLSQTNLVDCGKQPYKYSSDKPKSSFKQQVHKFLKTGDPVMTVQRLADKIIAACEQNVTEKLSRKNNYHETYIQEILLIIDDSLNKEDMHKDMDFEVSLKQHICANAARQFEQMQQKINWENDSYLCLMKNKEKFRSDFKDLFHERDQCQKKAEEFADRCLRPAVEDFINRSLGPDIVGKMLTCQEFSTQMSFQYSVLSELLKKDDFDDFMQYTCFYEKFVKQWILDKISKHFSDSSTIFKFENQHLHSCLSRIHDAITAAKEAKSATLKDFVEIICRELDDKLVLSKDELGAFMILNNANHEQFAIRLTERVNEMGHFVQRTLRVSDIQIKLQGFHLKPQNELFDRIIGCGKQCPFCKAPCEAGGRVHTKHWTSLHRPEGLGTHRWEESQKLVTDICSSLVFSDRSFRCKDTKNKCHPYKSYRDIYPDWKISSDVNHKASDYWKYVLTKFNHKFAEAHNAMPADIPLTWRLITRKRAKKSLKASFGIN